MALNIGDDMLAVSSHGQIDPAARTCSEIILRFAGLSLAHPSRRSSRSTMKKSQTRTRVTLPLIALVLSVMSSPVLAVDAVYTGFFSNTAIRGYDAVAYFTEGRPVEGKDQYELEYQGATWKFNSAENLEKFRDMPEKYAPQYGGYCAWAMANGDIASAEPDLWTIHEGKLYLNYSRQINTRWKADMLEFIQQADREWPQIKKEQN